MTNVPFWAWLVLGGVAIGGIVVDLVAHRGERGQGRKTAIVWSAIWIALALAFAAWLAVAFGGGAGEDFLTAYVVEKSLSIDNLFVFLVVFSRLRIPAAEQHRVLSWGIIGALVARAIFIASGAAVLSAWHGVVYVLGAFLVYTGVKTARERPSAEPDEREGPILQFFRRRLPLTPRLDGHRFVTIENGRRVATPLLLALLVVEATDVVFAIDSVPAVFAVSREPFIVYASNVFAVLGLRALYLVLADVLAELRYLRYGLAAILVFAGAKMLGSGLFELPHAVSLFVVLGILVAVVVPSLFARARLGRRAR